MVCAQKFSYARYENLFAHTVAVGRLHLLKHNDLMHIFTLFIYNSALYENVILSKSLFYTKGRFTVTVTSLISIFVCDCTYTAFNVCAVKIYILGQTIGTNVSITL